MEKIASFTVDHLLLEPGVYVSRVDSWQGIDVTTLDLRMVAPNREPPMDTAAVHALDGACRRGRISDGGALPAGGFRLRIAAFFSFQPDFLHSQSLLSIGV